MIAVVLWEHAAACIVTPILKQVQSTLLTLCLLDCISHVFQLNLDPTPQTRGNLVGLSGLESLSTILRRTSSALHRPIRCFQQQDHLFLVSRFLFP